MKFCLGWLACVLVVVLIKPVGAQDPNSLSESLQSEPLSQLSSDAQKFGDPQRGAMAFYEPTMNCARCHVAQADGRRLGPDLSEKRKVDIPHLIESILQPSEKIKEGFETAMILQDDGRQITGIIVKETATHLVVDQIEQPEKPLQIPKDSIDDWTKTKTSTMPEKLANQLADRQQFLDLISYLNEIAINGAGRAAELKPAGLGVLPPLPEYETHVDHAGLIRGLDHSSFERGAETYRLRCASCHGTLNKNGDFEEGSMPTSLRFDSGKFKNGNEPYRLYQTLTHGYGMMIPQRWMVPQQKYEVIHYIREQFLKQKNRSELFAATDAYLKTLPAGDTRGPKPVVSRPWTLMDYGHSLFNTIEVSDDGTNIAQKGIAIRLDDGPGGVESGSHWLMYEHDTMRVAGAWAGNFIDWEGIHFNGTHGRHPGIAGEIHFANPTAPGFGRPQSKRVAESGNRTHELFKDDRVVGRDGKHYGPLPKDWSRYQGMYRFGKHSILKYQIGETQILESPSLNFVAGHPVYLRTLNVGERIQDLVIQVAKVKGVEHTVETDVTDETVGAANSNFKVILPPDELLDDASIGIEMLEFGGNKFAEIVDGDLFDLTDSDFSIFARIKTKNDGTIFSQTMNQDQWGPQGKSFFIRGGKLTFDIGWVGEVSGRKTVSDGKWHDVAMTWKKDKRRVTFFVDGKQVGGGELAPKATIKNQVVRLGFTNANFPKDSNFDGSMAEVRFYQRLLSTAELATPATIKSDKLVGNWSTQTGSEIRDVTGNQKLTAIISGSDLVRQKKLGLLAGTSFDQAEWMVDKNENLRLIIRAGGPINLTISQTPVSTMDDARVVQAKLAEIQKPRNLVPLTQGGPPSYSTKLTTKILRGNEDGSFAVDVFERPVVNPWNCQLRLTGLDFLPDGDTAVVSAWDGSVWRVSGFRLDATQSNDTLTWQRIAAGLFQPLGVKIQDEKIYVTCRDQIVILHDLNGDHEADWYENFNSDHQVTEHFHEFAMGLQTDADGNFYYAKSARHAKTAVVPHHGTLLKITSDGSSTEILANGFRAANGVCLNPDGSFVVTDQEGHWNPKNRINWVRPGEFYGNMFGYHDVTDESDSEMSDPLCWITNEFDRSPSELLWVDSEKWGPFNGSLLNFSYGYGKIYVVPHEEVDGQMQGGMCEIPLPQFPTGVMRGRFHPVDGQLYCCGMFAWAGSQQQPGGLYRVRYTGKPIHLPVGLGATEDGIEIEFSDLVDGKSASDASNYSINTWDLKRTKNYGSKHFNEKRLNVEVASVSSDGQTVKLVLPEIKPTWGMEINYSIKTKSGKRLQGKIHNSVFKLKK